MPESEAFCYSVGEKCGLAALFLRYAPDRFSLTNANTSCTIDVPASLRSENCSPSARNAVRVPPGISVRLQRNPQVDWKERNAWVLSREPIIIKATKRGIRILGASLSATPLWTSPLPEPQAST